jgi:hypothetical protein
VKEVKSLELEAVLRASGVDDSVGVFDDGQRTEQMFEQI